MVRVTLRLRLRLGWGVVGSVYMGGGIEYACMA